MSGGSPLFSSKLPYKVRCELGGCGKPVNMVFRQSMDGNMVNFCSPYHAREGEKRWEEKKKLNIKPGVPPNPREDIMIEGNTEELIE